MVLKYDYRQKKLLFILLMEKYDEQCRKNQMAVF